MPISYIMKSYIIIPISIVASLFIAAVSLEEAFQYFKVPGGVQNVDKKVLKKPDAQFMPYVALKFRTGTKGTARVGKGQNVETSTAYAVLDGIDDALFQEITDEFYDIYTSKMADAGIPYADYDKISASKTYKKYSVENVDSREYDHKDNGTAKIFTQNNVPFFNYPTLITKIGKMQKEVGAGLTTLRLTIDFVEFDMEMKRSYSLSYRRTESSANVLPAVKVTSTFQEGSLDQALTGSYFNAPGLYITNTKLFSAGFQQQKPIFAAFDAKVSTYDDKVPQFANKANNWFGGGMQLGTFVVEPTREDYKKAALQALTQYAEMIATIAKSYQK